MKKNNQAIFKTPFSLAYWKVAAQETSIVKNIVLISLLIAMAIVFEGFAKIIGFKLFDRYVYLSFIPISLLAMLFGPLVAIGSGVIIDVLGFFMIPSGYPFYPGYTLSSILVTVIYALFLYRTKISLLRIFLAKFSVNLLVNVGLGSLWMTLMGWGAGSYMGNFWLGLTKNMLLLPIEVFIMFYFLRAMIPISQDLGVLSKEISPQISII